MLITVAILVQITQLLYLSLPWASLVLLRLAAWLYSAPLLRRPALHSRGLHNEGEASKASMFTGS